MIEMNATILGQVFHGIDAQIPFASVPVSPNSRRHRSAAFVSSQRPFHTLGSTSSRPGIRSAASFNIHHVDTGVSKPVPAFFVSGAPSLPQTPA